MDKGVRAVCQVYWPNGQLMSKGAMVDGKVNGVEFIWWQNGKLAREAFFEMGAPSGVWKYYDQTGQFVGQGSFLFGGRCNGIFIGEDNPGPDFFLNDGSLKKQFFESGKLIKEEVFLKTATF